MSYTNGTNGVRTNGASTNGASTNSAPITVTLNNGTERRDVQLPGHYGIADTVGGETLEINGRKLMAGIEGMFSYSHYKHCSPDRNAGRAAATSPGFERSNDRFIVVGYEDNDRVIQLELPNGTKYRGKHAMIYEGLVTLFFNMLDGNTWQG